MKSNVQLKVESDELYDYVENSMMRQLFQECEIIWDRQEQKWWLRMKLHGKRYNYSHETCDKILSIYKAAEKSLGF